MPQVIQVIDPLWHCLCPSFTRFPRACLTLPRALSHSLQATRSAPPKEHPWRSGAYQQKNFHSFNVYRSQNRVIRQRSEEKLRKISAEVSSPEIIADAYEQLSKVSKRGDFIRTIKTIRFLVEKRLEPPNSQLYQALLAALTDPQHGSPAEVKLILREMRDENILPDLPTYHAILKVLAIHPDYIFRNQILEELEQRWYSLNESGHCDVILGLLRDRQIEMALNKLEKNRSKGMRVPTYLYDIMVYTLCDLEEYEEVLEIMQYRINSGEKDISASMWAHILDTASRALHHRTTLYAWSERVDSDYLNPSSGVCINVLNTAARHGDYRLATKVLQVLGRRSSTLQIYHYESLLEAYLNAGDLRTTFIILTTMMTSGNSSIHPEEATTRPIFTYIRSSPSLTAEALQILHNLKDAGRFNPPVAVNCIIEAFIDQNNLESAIETYKLLRTLCPPDSKPLTQTFNILFRGCSKFSRKDLAQFLFQEMQYLDIQPDELTFDRLILTCLGKGIRASEDNEGTVLDDAWEYLNQMVEKGWWPRRGTLIALAKRAVEEGDEKVFGLVEDMERRKMDVGGLGRWVGETWKGKKGGGQKSKVEMEKKVATKPNREVAKEALNM